MRVTRPYRFIRRTVSIPTVCASAVSTATVCACTGVSMPRGKGP